MRAWLHAWAARRGVTPVPVAAGLAVTVDGVSVELHDLKDALPVMRLAVAGTHVTRTFTLVTLSDATLDAALTPMAVEAQRARLERERNARLYR